MTLHIAKAGKGLLVVGYHVGSVAVPALAAALPPDACILTDCDDGGGRYSRPPGAGGVEPISAARATAGLPDAPLVLVGWSAGCQAVREQLRAGVQPAAVVALDGISGSWPGPTPEQLAPWHELVARALAGELLFVLSHTQQVYTETIPRGVQGGPFASTVTTTRLLCEAEGLTAPNAGAEACFGEAFHVVSTPSPSISATAHVAQVREVLPDVARRIVAPWLAGRAESPPDTEPAPVGPPRTLAELGLEVAVSQLGVSESPAGSNRGTQVDLYEKPSGLLGAPWCEDFESWRRQKAADTLGVPNALGYHASVASLWRAAVALGKARPKASGYQPKPGDAAIWKRGGQNPMLGGTGHVEVVEVPPAADGTWTSIGGNEADAVRRAVHRVDDVDLVGWVEV